MTNEKVTLQQALLWFKEAPLLVEQFADVTEKGELYSKIGSPLLSKAAMTAGYSPIAGTLLSKVPLYHSASEYYTATRDPAALSVPIPMRTTFWESLFSDAVASERNGVLLETFNKLRYPYIGEEHILNRSLFKKLLSSEETSAASARFVLIDGTVDDTLDSSVIDHIIKERLRGTYALCNYTSMQSAFIDKWMDSLYLSGQISYEDRIREENLYRVQDLKAELLRRKVAGSLVLYQVVLSAINRRGTHAPAIPLKTVTESEVFKDNRLIRALHLPGITVDTAKQGKLSADPHSVFGERIPFRTLEAIFYTSTVPGKYSYDSDVFAGLGNISMASFLRAASTTFAWDNVRGILDTSLLRDRYPRFDTGLLMDVGESLDQKSKLFNLSFVSTTMFSIQADQVLYHQSSLQQATGHNYPYVTYTIADNNSLSMMDLPWLEYVANVIDDKTRVQEKIELGVQVSKLLNNPAPTAEDGYTVMTFDSKLSVNFSEQASEYQEGHKYAFLWYVRVVYDAETYHVQGIRPSLMTYMLLKVDEDKLSAETKEVYGNHPSWRIFTGATTGLMPFAYSDFDTDEVLSRIIALDDEQGLVDDLYSEELTKAMFLFTVNESVAISKRYLNMTVHTLTSSIDGEVHWYHRPPTGTGGEPSSAALKHVIYGLKRIDLETKEEKTVWSEPLRLYSKGDLLNNFWQDHGPTALQELQPDWRGLVFYLNPYLTVKEQSASPLRYKDNLPRALRPASDENPVAEELPSSIPSGPSSWSALRNLAVWRGHHVYVNDSGELTDGLATYWHRVRQQASSSTMPYDIFIATEEKLRVYGDNRPYLDGKLSDDPADYRVGSLSRSAIYTDPLGVESLYVVPGSQYRVAESAGTYYTLQPAKDISSVDWKKWIWNNPDNEDFADGVTICVDCNLLDPAEERGLDEATSDICFISHRGDASSAINASFEFYLTPQHELTFDVWPSGKVLGDKWTVSMPAEFMVEAHAQIAASYKAMRIDGDTLHVQQSLVADRRHTTSYKTIIREPNGTYSVYETDHTFDIIGVAPLQTAIDVSYLSNHFYGELVRNKGEISNSLKEICVLNRNRGYSTFFGTLYDYRVYRRGVCLPELVVLCGGTRCELYSYSPSLYKLANQFYIDPGIIKKPVILPPQEMLPRRVRAFSRPLWDSILIDPYPATAEEKTDTHRLWKADYRDPRDDRSIYDELGNRAEGLLEQILVQHYEADNDIAFPSGIDIYYRGRSVGIDDRSSMSFVQTVLYPMVYNDEAFQSGLLPTVDPSSTTEAYITYKASGTTAAAIPSTPVGKTLIYEADLDMSFKLPSAALAASPIVKGLNIGVAYNVAADNYYVHHIDKAKVASTADNYVVYPLYIPSQSSYSHNPLWRSSLQGIELSGVALSAELMSLLKSSSYYGELQVPFPVEVNDDIKYTSRWNALRVLKEGVYYITCKYPIQVYPLNNQEQLNIRSATTVYASARFKVVVRGTATQHDEALLDSRPEWRNESLKRTLTDRGYSSADNRTYPHRLIDIDLYVLKDNIYPSSWLWEKIASNYDNRVQLLDRAFISAADTILDVAIPFYFSSSYTAPLINKEGEVDVVKYTLRGKTGQTDKEVFDAGADYDRLTLFTGNTYKLLLDYSANIAELSYNPEPHLEAMFQELWHYLTPVEIDSYKTNTNIIYSNSTERQYLLPRVMYKSALNWASLAAYDFDLNTVNNGFLVEGNAFTAPRKDYAASDCALGDPYSNAATKNMLVEKFPTSRRSIENLGFFPYRQSLGEALIPAAPFDDANRLPSVINLLGNDQIISPAVAIDEYNILKDRHDQISRTVENSLYALKQYAGGAFRSFMAVQPLFALGDSLILEEDITPQTHDFLAYYPNAHKVMISSDISVKRSGFYGNDLMQTHQIIDTPSLFDLANSLALYKYDAELDKDVVAIKIMEGPSKAITYKTAVPNNFLLLLKVKSEKGCTLTIATSSTIATESLEANKWTTLAIEAASAAHTSMTLTFSATFAGEYVYVESIQLRPKEEYIHWMGLSSASTAARTIDTPELILPGATVDRGKLVSLLAFKNKKTLNYFPIQMKNRLAGAISDREETKATLILNYGLGTGTLVGDELPLLRPWKRRLIFKEERATLSSLYQYVTLHRDGEKVEALSTSPVSTILAIDNSAELEANRSVQFNDSTNSIEIGGDVGIRLSKADFATILPSNLSIAPTVPLYVSNEKFSLVSNCVNPSKVLDGESSVVAITNIQIVNNDEVNPAVLYEVEYLPIIYDETVNHLAVNFLIKNN